MKKKDLYINRDISWLSFNDRVLDQAGRQEVPLLEKLQFLAIFSSNLDEFYRVRMPVLMAWKKIMKQNPGQLIPNIDIGTYKKASKTINRQQEKFGLILADIIQELAKEDILLIYNQAIPAEIKDLAAQYFFTTIASYLQIIPIDDTSFFPINNQLYFVITDDNTGAVFFLNVPSNHIGRFFTCEINGNKYVVLIDDIIKAFFPEAIRNTSLNFYSFKITRDAELNLQDEFEGDIAQKIETEVNKRDLGYATRFLFQPNLPKQLIETLATLFDLRKSSIVEGGNYHNLKDLFSFPIKIAELSYPKQLQINTNQNFKESIFDQIDREDLLICTPYESFDPILRFFNEAAIDPTVDEIYTTLYRIAGDSHIAQALATAAKNGKRVNVFVELKARFDEANNIHWARLMKEQGVKITYSIPNLKVHAKIALVKRKQGRESALLGTGNLNEKTAKVYTDYFLITSNKLLTNELNMLFEFLPARRKPHSPNELPFSHLLIAQFNLKHTFLSLIDQATQAAKAGETATIKIKLNNLEEESLINKLYEASRAGVKLQLLVRGICRLKPQVPGLSDNIVVKRIVGRYLEHGRIFIFQYQAQSSVYLGSSDWMNRNIYRRIETCFPLLNLTLAHQIQELFDIQFADDTEATLLDEHGQNQAIETQQKNVSQQQILNYLTGKMKK
ncbi:polyphosphate kinase 1 [uncultured Sphingobacterium sp.]|uniref:polyphosphate kinase 1 n=1 Tax=uncultured Sphingobacterium sp. TaxID=182688 RepID=UPI003749736A